MKPRCLEAFLTVFLPREPQDPRLYSSNGLFLNIKTRKPRYLEACGAQSPPHPLEEIMEPGSEVDADSESLMELNNDPETAI